MAYKALYRTYRPQTFDEVAGQQHIVKTLKNALATGKIAHAYLFAGPRGTGKTTMAKLFAKALNCEQGIGQQCDQCKNCKSIIDGSHPDVLELDAASNNGVDEIRELIDKVKYGTILGRYKVYIIDEVHMLSTGAFNALLKTLEEPPEHVIFILATTEPHKILPTILSRCQRYDFEKVSDQDIKERIRVVLNQEGIPFNDDAVALVVKLADGGMRDALSILEKVLAYSGNQLNVSDILNIFSLESTEEKIKLLTSIVNKDTKDVLDRLNHYVSKGSDLKRLTDDLLSILKDILVYNNTSNTNYLEILKEDEAIKIASLISNDKAIKMIDILLETIKDFKTVTSIVPIFEITLLKMTSLGEANQTKPVETPVVQKPVVQQKIEIEPKIEHTQSIIENQPKIEPVIEQPKVETITPVETRQIEEETKPLFDQKIQLDKNVIYLKDAEGEDSFSIDESLLINIIVTSKKEIKKDLLDGWKNIKKFTMNPMLSKAASLLVDGHPLVASNKVIILEFPLKTNAEKVNLKENQLEIQTVISQVFNKKMFVYAVNRNQSVDIQQKYMSLLQLGQLPKAKDINLEFEGE